MSFIIPSSSSSSVTLFDGSAIDKPSTPYSASRYGLANKHTEQIDTAKAERDQYLIDWDGSNDPENPRNTKAVLEIYIGAVTGLLNFVLSFGISIYSGVRQDIATEFGVSELIATLGYVLFILGLAFGSIFWGPASELFGRKTPLMVGLTGFIVFTYFVAASRDMPSVLFCRFLAGIFGSAPITIPLGVYVDISGPVSQAYGTLANTAGGNIGSVLGPIVGASISQSGNLSWRWSVYITLIMSVPLLAATSVVPETFASLILQRKAARYRIQEGWEWHSRRDEGRQPLSTYLLKPARFLRSPILLLMTVFLTLGYGIQSLTYSAIPYTFQTARSWSFLQSSASLTGLIVGIVIGAISMALDTRLRFQKLLEEGGTVRPEKRLPPMLAGILCLAIGLFEFGWTSLGTVHWVISVIGIALIGCGIFIVWTTATIYVQDLYSVHANSALAAVAFVRFLTAAWFPFFSIPMYEALGVSWATTLLAFVCVALLPFPLLLLRFGDRLRKIGHIPEV